MCELERTVWVVVGGAGASGGDKRFRSYGVAYAPEAITRSVAAAVGLYLGGGLDEYSGRFGATITTVWLVGSDHRSREAWLAGWEAVIYKSWKSLHKESKSTPANARRRQTSQRNAKRSAGSFTRLQTIQTIQTSERTQN